MAVASLFEDLLDQYRIEQRLAEKRYTDLYQAYDVDEDRLVRLDILRLSVADDSAFAARFVGRARAVAQVRHPNIAPIYHIGKTPDGLPYVAQAHFDGIPLSQRLEQLSQRPTPVNTSYALKLVRQLADALVLAERLELFHYDLQPDNVLLKNVALPTDESLVLFDLFVPPDRGANRMAGPAEELQAFLSPEQRAGREVTSPAHVYSLGVLLYRLLAGHLPSGPVKRADMALSGIKTRGTLLEHERAGLHPLTYDLVNRSLRREPGRRFESVEAFLVALNAALVAEEAQVGAVSVRPGPGRRSLGWLMPIVILALIIVAAGFATRGQRGSLGAAAPTVAVVSAIDPTFTPAPSPTVELSPTAAATDALPPGETAAAPGVVGVPQSEPTDLPSVTPTMPPPEPTNTATPSPEPTLVPVIRVAHNLVNLRRGPGVVYGLLGNVRADESLQVLAWNDDEQNPWYLVGTADGRLGWIAAEVVRSEDLVSLVGIPVAATLPPTPFPTPTPSPSPTSTPPAVIVTVTVGAGGGDLGGGEEPEPPEPTDEPPVEEPTLTPPPLP